MRHTPRDVLDAKDTIDPWREPENEAPRSKARDAPAKARGWRRRAGRAGAAAYPRG